MPEAHKVIETPLRNFQGKPFSTSFNNEPQLIGAAEVSPSKILHFDKGTAIFDDEDDLENTPASFQGKDVAASLITEIPNETLSETNLTTSLTENCEPPENPHHNCDIEHMSTAVDLPPKQDVVPPIQDIDTPNISFDSASEQGQSSFGTTGSSDTTFESPDSLLRKIRVKNINKVIIGTLNINSLAPKFDQLREVIGNHLDILTIQETKLDSSFPTGQFLINGYSEPYRLDRNRNGGGVMIYVREDIPKQAYFH